MRGYLITFRGAAVGDSEGTARMFKVLSVGARVRIIDLLKRRSLCVNALSRVLGITPAAVSQHLRVLRDADVVIAEKRGNFVHYRVNEATLVLWGEAARSLLAATPEAGAGTGRAVGLSLPMAGAGKRPRFRAKRGK